MPPASLLLRVGALVACLLAFVAFDIALVPVAETGVFVPKPAKELLDNFRERKQRAKKQHEAASLQAGEVELSLFQLEGALDGVRIDPHNSDVLARLERLRGEVGTTATTTTATTVEDKLDDVELDDEDDESGGNAPKPKQSSSNKHDSEEPVYTLGQRMMQLGDPNRNPTEWAKTTEQESSKAMQSQMESWIVQGKTKRLGFDLKFDPGNAQGGAGNSGSGGEETEATATPVPKAAPGDSQRRFISRTKIASPPDMIAFVQSLRTRTYSHMSKNVDTERKLKLLGYKQKTANSAVAAAAGTGGGGGRGALFQGHFGESCPHFEDNERIVSFCNYFLPTYREQEQQQLLGQMHGAHPTLFPDGVDSFFPLTWRLYKQNDRRMLRTRTQNETLPQEGGPYVNKFSFSHGAGKPSITAKMFSQLRKSDESTRLQTQDAKQKMIAQWYCNNPYLFEGKKFIIRTWAIIVSAQPKMMVFYHDGALLRSVAPYSAFVKRDAHYKREAHFTNDQSKHKGTLRSSSLYASLGQFQHWLNSQQKESKTFIKDSLRPRIKARMIYALYAMMRPPPSASASEGDSAKDSDLYGGMGMGAGMGNDDLDNNEALPKKLGKLPKEVAVVQPVCFDFLLQEGGDKLWLLGAHTTAACMVNLGGDSFKPQWKVSLQTALADKLVELGEEMLWRKVSDKPLDSLPDLVTDLPLDVLIDETLPGFDPVEEMKWYAQGGHVDGGLGGRDVVEAIDASTDSKVEVEEAGGSGGGGEEPEEEEEED